MLSRMNGATLFLAQTRMQSSEWTAFARKAVKGFLTTAHRALLLLGVTAITALCMMFFNPNLADRLKALSPFAEAVKVQPVVAIAPPLTDLLDAPAKLPTTAQGTFPATFNAPMLTTGDFKYMGTPEQQHLVTNWLSKRYHVAGDAANMLVSASYSTARETKLDPLLILAVMCIESGLNPFAESPMGAQGLMQVMWKVHHARFDDLGGVKAALNPAANIRVGALILRDFVVRGGSVEAGLKSYVGAAAFDNDAGYGAKVLAEYHRLQEVSIGKNVPTTFAPVATTAMKQHTSDNATDGKPAETQIEPNSAALTPKQQVKAIQFAAL
jgi:soluble lytic murein transglycosylase-like protein